MVGRVTALPGAPGPSHARCAETKALKACSALPSAPCSQQRSIRWPALVCPIRGSMACLRLSRRRSAHAERLVLASVDDLHAGVVCIHAPVAQIDDDLPRGAPGVLQQLVVCSRWALSTGAAQTLAFVRRQDGTAGRLRSRAGPTSCSCPCTTSRNPCPARTSPAPSWTFASTWTRPCNPIC